MDEETFNKEIRSFLKKVGVTSQQEIDKAVRQRLENGRLSGDEQLSAKVVLRVPEIDLELEIDGQLQLEQ